MANTTNLSLTLLEVGQKDKEVTINTNMQTLDGKICLFLGDLATDPATTYPHGSTYFNTQTNKTKILRANATWVNIA